MTVTTRLRLGHGLHRELSPPIRSSGDSSGDSFYTGVMGRKVSKVEL